MLSRGTDFVSVVPLHEERRCVKQAWKILSVFSNKFYCIGSLMPLKQNIPLLFRDFDSLLPSFLWLLLFSSGFLMKASRALFHLWLLQHAWKQVDVYWNTFIFLVIDFLFLCLLLPSGIPLSYITCHGGERGREIGQPKLMRPAFPHFFHAQHPPSV